LIWVGAKIQASHQVARVPHGTHQFELVGVGDRPPAPRETLWKASSPQGLVRFFPAHPDGRSARLRSDVSKSDFEPRVPPSPPRVSCSSP